MSQAHVQVVLDNDRLPPGIDEALREIGATVSFVPISEAVRQGVKPTADAIVVAPRDDSPNSREELSVLMSRVARNPRATLVIHPETGQIAPLNAPASVPISYSNRSGIADLAARISTLISMRVTLESLHREREAERREDELRARRYEQQLLSASRLQREMLPRAERRFEGASFSVVYRAQEYVSGDIYDIRKLDDEHVAIAVSDAQGHGICAGLLTVFIKRALAGEIRRNQPATPSRPGEVLARLNEELLDAELSETQFSAAVYALLNLRTKRLEVARGGAPYPILRRANGRCELIETPGFLIGVSESATFATETIELSSGDAVLFYSDGVEQIIKCAETSARTSDKDIESSDWFARLGREGVDAGLEQLAARHDTLRRLGRTLDDLTALALKIE